MSKYYLICYILLSFFVLQTLSSYTFPYSLPHKENIHDLDCKHYSSGCPSNVYGYCDSFQNFKTDFWTPGEERLYLIIACTFEKGTYIYDYETMQLVKKWTNRKSSQKAIQGGGVQHSSSIEMYGNLLICFEDWDGLEALDYTSEGPNQLQGTIALPLNHCTRCGGNRTVHRQMIQVVDPVTLEGGKFIYIYFGGYIRYTQILSNNGAYCWNELRANPIKLDNEIKGVSQIEGTWLVIISTVKGFKILDSSKDHLPEIDTITDATNSDLDCQFAVHLKGSRMLVTYDQGTLKVFEMSPPDVLPITIYLVKKQYTNQNKSVQQMKSFSGRRFGFITQHTLQVFDVSVIDNDNIDTPYPMKKIKELPVDNNGNRDFSPGLYQVPETNILIYNNNIYDVFFDYLCHYSCGDCDPNETYGKCTSCAVSSDSSTTSSGLKIELERTLSDDGKCECNDPQDQCSFIDIGSQFCYHESVFSKSPTKCCGTNSCYNEPHAMECLKRSKSCPNLQEQQLVFDEPSGYWYNPRGSLEYNCYFSCYYCIKPDHQELCRDCDGANTNRYLNTGISPAECVCKNGYYQQNPDEEYCHRGKSCVDECAVCDGKTGNCLQCKDGNDNIVVATCKCVDGYYHHGSLACVTDVCDEQNTNREYVGGNCQCLDGYQETSPVSDKCEEIPCVAKCAVCNKGVCEQCLQSNVFKDMKTCECLPGYFEDQYHICELDCKTASTNKILVNGYCVCKQGYLENDNDKCVQTQCSKNPKCQTCNRYQDKCDQCIGTDYQRASDDCKCNAGYIDMNNVCTKDCNINITNRVNDPNDSEICICKPGFQETTPVSDLCEEIKCSSECKLCSLGVCIECKGGNLNKNPATCDCLPGYIYSNFECLKDCQTDTTNRINDPSDSEQCICDQGYQETNPVSANCEEIPCVDKCQTCSLGVCQKCFEPANRESQTCECINGYHEVGGKCVLNCFTETTNKELVNDACQCLSGYYLPNASDAKCVELPCVDKCTSCSLGVCSACIGGNTNKNSQTCECNSGYLELDDNTCEFDCDTANTFKKWDQNTNQCECIQGYNDDDNPGTCVEDVCNSKCQSCSLGVCSQCIGSTVNRKPAGSNQAESCFCLSGFEDFKNQCRKICDTQNTNRENDPSNLNFCQCLQGYEDLTDPADDSDNCTEKTCFPKCGSCSLGVCQSCKNPKNRDINDSCECITGYHEVNGFCVLNCFTETTNKELVGGSCQCLAGYYQQNAGDANCVELPCVDLCQTCSLGVCSLCKNGNDNKDLQTCQCVGEQRFLENNCVCSQGYYDDGENSDCQKCEDNCLSCDKNGCQQCVDGYFLNDQKQCQRCQEGCRICNNANTCLDLCDDDCKYCKPDDSNTCTECAGDFRVAEQDCTCQVGYYEETSSQQCQKCRVNCQSCTDSSSCQQPCSFKCKYCDGVDVNKCTECIHETRDNSKNCACIPGYYEDPSLFQIACFQCRIRGCRFCDINGCTEQCDYKCRDCEAVSGACTRCSERNRDKNNDCLCKDEFYEDENQRCQACAADCLKCTGPDIRDCTACIVPEYFPFNNCQPGPNQQPSFERQVALLELQEDEQYLNTGFECNWREKKIINPDNPKDCICDFGYIEQENGECLLDEEKIINERNLKNFESVTRPIFILVWLALALTFRQYSMFMITLDTLQYIYYTIFMQVEFPVIVQEYFILFGGFNFDFIPSIIPKNQEFVSSPKGFMKNDIDGFLFRNLSSYIVLSFILLITYLIASNFQKYFEKLSYYDKLDKQIDQSKKIFFDKLAKFFEVLVNGVLYDFFAVGVLDSFMTCLIAAFLQITVLKIDSPFQFAAFSTSFILLFYLVISFIGTVALTKKIFTNILKKKVEAHKSIKEQQQQQEETEKFVTKNMFLFELFNTSNLPQVGLYIVMNIRKTLFAISIVLFNSFPVLTQVINILLPLLFAGFILVFKPFKHDRNRNIAVLNEILLTISYIFTMQFNAVKLTGSNEVAADIMIVCVSTILVNTILLCCYELAINLKNMRKKSKDKQAQKESEITILEQQAAASDSPSRNDDSSMVSEEYSSHNIIL